MFSIHFTVDSPGAAPGTGTICIDSAFIPPAGPFNFSDMSGFTDVPLINGPLCFPIVEVVQCPYDSDADGFGDPGHPENEYPEDSCPNAFNPEQTDSDGDSVGDTCDACTDTDSDGNINISDPVYVVAYIFQGGPPPPNDICGDVNGDGNTDIRDAVYLINYIFKEGPEPVCP